MRARVHRIVYLSMLALLGVSMTTSVWLSNLAWVAMGVNWLLEGRWREKWQMARESRLLQAFAVLWALYLAGMLWTEHLQAGLGVLQVALPLLALPLVALTSQPVGARVRKGIFLLYGATVVAVSVVAAVRLLTIDGLAYRDAVPHISHIRFALNCCVVAFLAAYYGWHRSRSPMARGASALLVAWMVAVMLLLRSYTGLAVLAAVPMAALLLRWRRVRRSERRVWLAAWLAAAIVAGGTVAHEVRSYYKPGSMSAPQPAGALTAAGHAYDAPGVPIVENGNLIYAYVCRDELKAAWRQRSSLPLDDTNEAGFSREPVLIRYLNAVGLTKDSLGVASLADDQVRDVERWVENPVYVQGNPVKKMVYVMCFERECGKYEGAVRNFTMLQRFELWRAAWEVVRSHPLAGTGTGDAAADLGAQLEADRSPLAGWPHKAHNEYLTLLMSFGAVGMLLLAAAWLRAAPRLRRQPAWLLMWALAILVSMLTEDTLDTLAGILFCTYFLPFRTNDRCTNTIR